MHSPASADGLDPVGKYYCTTPCGSMACLSLLMSASTVVLSLSLIVCLCLPYTLQVAIPTNGFDQVVGSGGLR
jgi:hypothetical protein